MPGKELEFIEAGIDLLREQFAMVVRTMVNKQAEDGDVTLKVSIHIDEASSDVNVKTAVSYTVPEKSKVEFKTLPGQYCLDYDDGGAYIVSATRDQERFDGWEG